MSELDKNFWRDFTQTINYIRTLFVTVLRVKLQIISVTSVNITFQNLAVYKNENLPRGSIYFS